MNLYLSFRLTSYQDFAAQVLKDLSGCYLEIDLMDSRIINSEIRETSWGAVEIIHAKKKWCWWLSSV